MSCNNDPCVRYSKFDATAAPTVNDDDTADYVVGSLWFDVTNVKNYVCSDATTGAAVWHEITIKETDGQIKTFNTINIYDTTGAEFAPIERTLTNLLIDSGTDATLILLVAGAIAMNINGAGILCYDPVYPNADGSVSSGTLSYYWSGLFADKINVGDDELIESKESLGVARALNLNIPIGAGGAAAAAIDMQQKLDGTLEAGLLAETDGAGTYREPVFKIPAYSADYGEGWGTPPNPTPASLTNGCQFAAHNTFDNTYRVYTYLNGGWHYSALT